MSDISQFLRWFLTQGESSQVFCSSFENYHDFCQYLTTHFSHTNFDVHATLKSADKVDDAAAFFQALFVACWLYKPMEKGTYFLRMTPTESQALKKAFEKLPTRKSSHLNGKGRSAHKGFAFLKGYSELLVQWVPTEGRSYVMLKCEGHTTGLGSLYPHLKSWNHKRKTGAGLVANPSLNDVANREGNPIIDRGAENFSNDYKAFLKSLNEKPGAKNMQKATTTVRDMLSVLNSDTKWQRATNQEVITELRRLIGGPAQVGGITISQGVKTQFSRFAKLFELENRPDAIYHRYFEEVHVNPRQLSNAIIEFLDEDSGISLLAQTKRRSEMLAKWD